MLSFQTKALVVTPISSDNFRLIPPNCMPSFKRFLSNFNVVAIQTSLDGFRNILNVVVTGFWQLRNFWLSCKNFVACCWES